MFLGFLGLITSGNNFSSSSKKQPKVRKIPSNELCALSTFMALYDKGIANLSKPFVILFHFKP